MKVLLRSLQAGAGTLRELVHFAWRRKAWWLIPMLVILVLTALLLLFAQATGTAPFVYPPF